MQRLPARILRGIAEPQVLYSVDWVEVPASPAPAETPESGETQTEGAAEPVAAQEPDPTP